MALGSMPEALLALFCCMDSDRDVRLLMQAFDQSGWYSGPAGLCVSIHHMPAARCRLTCLALTLALTTGLPPPPRPPRPSPTPLPHPPP